MAPPEAKNRPKKGGRGRKNDPKLQVEPRSAPRRPQGRPGTPPEAAPPTLGSLLGDHLGTPKPPKTDPKTRNNRSEKKESNKKRSKRIKDPSWSDLGRFGGAMWEPEGPKSIGKRTISCTITFSKIRRFEDGFGPNLGRPDRQKAQNGPPRRAQDRPQKDPKPTPK